MSEDPTRALPMPGQQAREVPSYGRVGPAGLRAQHPESGDRDAVGLEPEVDRLRLEVAAVELGVGALLLDDEHVDPQPAQAVHL